MYALKNIPYTSVAYRLSREEPEFVPTTGAQPSLAPSTTDNSREWSAVIRDFLSAAGLTQAVRGFDADMVIMNPSFEHDVVPGALDDLLDSLVVSYACRLAAPVTRCVSWSRTGSYWGNGHNAHLRGDTSISASWSMCTCAPEPSLELKGAPGVLFESLAPSLTPVCQPDDQGNITFPCKESCPQ